MDIVGDSGREEEVKKLLLLLVGMVPLLLL